MGEMQEKIELHLHQGAIEVWLCDLKGNITYYDMSGQFYRDR